MKKKVNENQITLLDYSINYQEEYKKAVIHKIKTGTEKAFRFSSGEFISWMGGKTKVAKELSAMLCKIPHDVFVDSFFGGGAEFWVKPRSKHNIINDKNENLFNLLDVIRTNLNDMMYFIYHTVKSEDKFRQWRKLYKSNSWLDIGAVERAAIYYYLMFFTVNSDESTMGFSHTKQPEHYNTKNMYARIIRASEMLQGVSVYNRDFAWIVDRFNNDKLGKVLFFFDPPYFITNTGSYYKESARENSADQTTLHKRLKLCCDKIEKAENYFFITYDNVPFIRNLFSNYNIIPFQIQYGSNSKTATEIIITNSKFHEQMDMFS